MNDDDRTAFGERDWKDGAGSLAARVNWLVEWNDDHGIPMDRRIMKIAEENGEVVETYFGLTGANPRKGVTNGMDAVWAELADVALAALVNLQSLGADPVVALCDRADFVVYRIATTPPRRAE